MSVEFTPCLCPLTKSSGPHLFQCPDTCSAEVPDLCHAIDARRVVRFIYSSHLRVVEPHCYGITIKGHQALRAFQRNYGGLTPQAGWHLFRVDKISGLTPTTISFAKPRPDYNPNDRLMTGFFARLPM